jgi:hypothetical protein
VTHTAKRCTTTAPRTSDCADHRPGSGDEHAGRDGAVAVTGATRPSRDKAEHGEAKARVDGVGVSPQSRGRKPPADAIQFIQIKFSPSGSKQPHFAAMAQSLPRFPNMTQTGVALSPKVKPDGLSLRLMSSSRI